ncbi:TetR/AcrR family transcriptional regulator [Salmonella enterica subsp. enterica]|uniref:Putative transcriptional regulator-TetR family n=1 Tax=Salmonella bongori TaxID=54736 RepID=F2Q8G8_SALBN|nr:TetR/AcrR family transcriptional regulator [Salmonella enterica]EBS1106891.1 TetR/AcrR family transcriptional regulator [Salmonella enterica subsp. enterica serovar Eingedi]EBV2191139.1 TetR/AcrR family transcriptional regulator [Salmonella enterica subsp. enterica serovar Afula]ECH9426642.1 TetR/AcrR family transcriptional regulator [Salmonella enterica subsp. enterica]EDL6287966.1 TetR/AcrR family transcriptional regulator [Salmonella enterica subsp. enterica serovar Kottbus]EDS7420336.1 
MSMAHQRKKDPEKVRLKLIESARKLAMENGLAGVNVEAVAAEAGVSRGELVHHFPNKQVLVDSVFRHMLLEFESELENYMSNDPEPYGRFTRAYIRSVFDSEAHSQWGPLWIATATDPQLRLTWGEWFNTQVLRHNETDLLLENARFAADGVWMGQMYGVVPGHPEALRKHLINMTTPEK